MPGEAAPAIRLEHLAKQYGGVAALQGVSLDVWPGEIFGFLGLNGAGKTTAIRILLDLVRPTSGRASVFGMQVAYSVRQEVDPPEAGSLSLDRLLNTSDIVSLHVPLTSETHHLIDKRALVRMKRSAYLVNTSRGPVVDEAALAWALQEHLIAGAALDVYEHEPKINPDLLALENALLVPHLGSATMETRTAMAELAVDNVLAVLAGRPALTPVS